MNTKSTSLVRSSSQYWKRADTASLSITGDFTIEMWVKLTELPSTHSYHMYLFGKGGWGTDAQEGYRLGIHSTTDTLRVYYSSAVNGSARSSMQSTDAFFDGDDVGVWVHVAVVVDVSAKTCVMYKNGVSVGVSVNENAAGAVADNNDEATIGVYKYSSSYLNLFDGLIDEVRIWNDIRTQQEIQDNDDVELDGDEAGLVAYWQFEDDGLDKTANNNDLTNINSATFSTSVPFAGSPDPFIPQAIIF